MVAAGPAQAQGQPWRHAIIEPKSDAGFQVMAVRGGYAGKQGLKLELPYFQNDVIALRGLLAGDLESYEGGAATAIIAAARNADVYRHTCGACASRQGPTVTATRASSVRRQPP